VTDEAMSTKALEYILGYCTFRMAKVARKARSGLDPRYPVIEDVPFLKWTDYWTGFGSRFGWTSAHMLIFSRVIGTAYIWKFIVDKHLN